MNQNDDEAAEAQQRDQEWVNLAVKQRIEWVEGIYNHAMTSLWLGNGSAALAVLSAIVATWKNGAYPRLALWPLGFFLLGLIAMGIGAVISLFCEGFAINRMQRATSILDFYGDDIRSPAERIGLTLSDGRTGMAIVAGFFFVAGCVVGFVLLLCMAP